MSSRKRKSSTIEEKEGKVSKRARLLSSLWRSQEETVDSVEEILSTPSSAVYRIKAIIGERPGEYLIDWADNPITGESFKADWQPKGNVNNAAVNVWGKRQNSSVESVPSRAKPQRRRRRRRPISSGDSTAGVTADKTPSPEAQYIHQTLSYTRTNKSPQDNKETARSSKNRSSTLETSNLPNLIVQISQHSSFDRDLYIAYQSSLSTQGTLPSVPEHPDSGLGESFSESDTPSPGPFEKDCIIPDSQSLPGSSSYIPTSNSSGSIAYVGKTPPSLGPYKSAPSQPNTPSKFESPNRELLQVDDSIDSSLLEIAASPSSVDIARRPASEPAPSSADNSSSSPFAARVPSLSRSTSDPTSIHYHDHRQQQQFQDHQKRVNHASDNQIDHNLLVQGSHISTSPTQAQAENNKQSKRFAIIQVPDSAESSSKSRQSPRAESLDQSLIFQTQVPLAFASRGSRVPIASAEGVWQSEHLASDTDQAVALTLSGTAEQSRRGSHQQTHINTKFIQNTPAHVRRRPTLPEPFVIAEDWADEQHPSQATTTDDSILNLRDANSQSSKNSHSRQSQDNSHKSVVPAVRYTTPIGSSGLEHQTLPHSLDSREPPQPPPSSDDKMSDLSPPAGSLSEGSQPLETRAKLRKIREESAAKLEASRRSREQVSNQSSARASPSGTPDERRPSVAPAVLIAHPILGGEGQHVSVPSADQKPQSSPAFDRHNLSHMRPIVGRRTKYPNVVFARSKPVAAPPSRRALSTPPVIPSKAPYKVQEEPSRLEVEPLVLSKEMPLPARNTQSVPHTPTTPSKLAMHTEALPSQTMTLEPITLGPAEYVIPLSMQPRIVSQYTDTMNYYRGAVTKNMTEETISKEVVEKLNTLLCRLGNVSTHIGLEGGGPSSQEMVEAKQEALYAEMSSEKFNLLAHLFAFIQDQQLHITLVAKDGHLINIIETFLKGKGIPYKRPGHLMEEPNLKDGKLIVSLIVSGDVCLTTTPRKADLVIALDETFDAADEQILAVRKPSAIRDDLTPVLRLVVYSSVEHLVLCLPPTLEPIDRIRNLIFCVYATRNLIGQIKSDDLPTQIYARNIAALIPHPNVFSQLPRIRPIEDIPTMDSDSTLSNSMSDTEMEQLNVQASRYFPYHNISRKRGDMGPSSPPPGGKRPFHIDFGDSLEVQAKKQKMARAEPGTSQDLQYSYEEAKEREGRLVKRMEAMDKQITDLNYWAERRQGDYEDLRDKWSNLHHDKIDLTAELEQKTKNWEKGRTEILSLKGERGTLTKEIEALRLQLLNHPNPAIAAAEREAAKIRTLEAENASLKKKNENLTKESTYIRDAYQQAASSATDLSNELNELKREVSPLRRSKEEFKAWRKAQRNDQEKLELRKEVDNLKVMVKSRERLVGRKEEQIKDLQQRGRGGVQTRGSSAQPRSPRGGSRGVSPAPGTLGGGGKGPSGLSGMFNVDG